MGGHEENPSVKPALIAADTQLRNDDARGAGCEVAASGEARHGHAIDRRWKAVPDAGRGVAQLQFFEPGVYEGGVAEDGRDPAEHGGDAALMGTGGAGGGEVQ